MSLDITTLALLKDREHYERIARAIPARALDTATRVVLADFGRYFKETPGAQSVDFAQFQTLFKLWHPTLDDAQLAAYGEVFKQVALPPNATLAEGLLNRLHETAAAAELAELAERYSNGEDINLTDVLGRMAERLQDDTGRQVEDPQCRDSFESILAEKENNTGLQFRLECLNKAVRPLVGGDFVIVGARVDTGKCLSPDTPVRMYPYGVKQVGAVVDGDTVMGPGGTPRTVTGTTRGRDMMFKVTYPWGESYTVNSAHVLSLREVGRDHVTNVSVAEYLGWSARRKANARGYKAGVEYPTSQAQRMPPYLLGLWLGDGTAAKPQITTTDTEVVEAFTAHYGQPSTVRGISLDYYRTDMLGDLRALGVLRNKHIPREYLFADRQQRLELLAGLLDSDGHKIRGPKYPSGYEIITKLDSLKDGYLELVRSLGIHATAKHVRKRATNGNPEGAMYWRITIGSEALGQVPVRLARHRGEQHPAPKRLGLNFGIEVECVGEGEYAGFCLDGDHLFLLGDFTVTHNTTLLASEVCWMAQQMDKLWPGQQRSVLWLVNEGHPRRTVERTLQAALGADTDELIAWAKDGTLRERYVAALGGRGGALRIFGVHDMTMGEIEHKIIRKHKPGVIVYDMLDNVKFDGDVANGGQRTDQLLEAMYQRARVQSVKYDCPVFATSQLNSEAEGVPWPALSMLANGRTGKPGTADLIIMLAKAADPTMDGMRFVSTPKNKLRKKGGVSTLRAEVVFQGDRAIITDTPTAS